MRRGVEWAPCSKHEVPSTSERCPADVHKSCAALRGSLPLQTTSGPEYVTFGRKMRGCNEADEKPWGKELDSVPSRAFPSPSSRNTRDVDSNGSTYKTTGFLVIWRRNWPCCRRGHAHTAGVRRMMVRPSYLLVQGRSRLLGPTLMVLPRLCDASGEWALEVGGAFCSSCCGLCRHHRQSLSRLVLDLESR